MPDDLDPLAHVPDPSKRYQVFAYNRGVQIVVEIADTVTKTGVTLNYLEALQVASDINAQLLHLFEFMTAKMNQGTLPEWERTVAEWGPHGESLAEDN